MHSDSHIEPATMHQDVATNEMSGMNNADEMSATYRTLWLVWGERRFIGRLVAIGTLAGIVLALLLPSRYTAKAQLMPPDATGGSMEAIAANIADKAGGLGTAAADLLGFKSSGALFVGIMQSRTVQDHLIDRFNLRKVYRDKYQFQARADLAERTEISEDRKSGLITLSVSDHDRERARQLAQAYVDELNAVVANSTMSAAARERQFLEQQIAETKKEVDNSARALAEFSSRSGTIDIKEQARSMVDAVAAVQGQLVAAESELKGLQSIYMDSNYRVIAVRAKVTELRRQLKQLGGKSGAQPFGDSAPYPGIRQLPELGVTFVDLYRRNKIADAVYESLVQQYEFSKMQEAKDTPKVQLLDAPVTPEVKSFPPRALIVLGCALLSLLFGAGWVVAAEQWAAVSATDPGKLLLQDIGSKIRHTPAVRGVRLRVRKYLPTRLPRPFKKPEAELGQAD